MIPSVDYRLRPQGRRKEGREGGKMGGKKRERERDASLKPPEKNAVLPTLLF